MHILKSSALIGVCVLLAGCFVAPLRVMEPLEVTVIDAETGSPIPNAEIVYLACDVHNRQCSHAHLVRTASSNSGVITIDERRKWGTWFPAPGGLPVPNHLIAIWAPGYSAYVFAQYGDTVESRKRGITRADILDALNAIPKDQSSSEPLLNPVKNLNGGKIRLKRPRT